MRIRARMRIRLTKDAIQNTAAIEAMTMKLRGETSEDVSDTMASEGQHLTRRLFGSMLQRIWALPVPTG
jgi:hypothetical protein